MGGEQGGKVWTGCIWLRTEKMASSCEHGNEASGFIKCGKILE
jgi:hypothetical protein